MSESSKHLLSIEIDSNTNITLLKQKPHSLFLQNSTASNENEDSYLPDDE